jgi:hypothetical protein
MLNPKRVKGIGAIASSFWMYSYLPYIAAYLGPTVPLMAVCFGGLYGMLSFAESQIINEITVVSSGEH